MSRYSMAIVSKCVTQDVLNTIGQKYNLMFTPIENLYIEKQLADKKKLCYLMQWRHQEYCCAVGDFELNELPVHTNDTVYGLFALGTRENMDELQSYVQNLDEIKKRENEQDAINWARFLSEFLRDCSSELGLLLHWYDGEIETEEVQIHETQILCADDVQSVRMPKQDDVLYIIKKT